MTQHGELVTRYKVLRRAGMALNNKLVENLPPNVFDEGGRALGLLKKKVLVLDTEDESSVLMDYCLFDVRHNGVNTIARYLEASPPVPGSDESIIAESLRHARYSLFAIEAIERGVGVHARDLLRGDLLFVVDIGLSSTAITGFVMATRIIAPEVIAITTGASLPVGVLSSPACVKLLNGAKAFAGNTAFDQLSPDKMSRLSTSIIRECLRNGAAERVAYVEPGHGLPRGRGYGEPLAGRAPAALLPGSDAGRNDPCPCGSGKKFKRCHGAQG